MTTGNKIQFLAAHRFFLTCAVQEARQAVHVNHVIYPRPLPEPLLRGVKFAPLEAPRPPEKPPLSYGAPLPRSAKPPHNVLLCKDQDVPKRYFHMLVSRDTTLLGSGP